MDVLGHQKQNSSLHEISKDQLGNRVVVIGEGVTPHRPAPPLLQQASGPIVKDDVNCFPSTSNLFYWYIMTNILNIIASTLI